jgi:Tfp pilus assembly protein PilF
MQDRIGQAIASALKVTLSGGERLLGTGTDSVDAHDLYLQGMFLLQKYTEKDLRSALALFARAIANDPRYAAPWAATSRAWINLADDWLPPRDAYPTALRAARRALVLDSTNADARALLGNIEQNFEWDLAASERELRRAVALDPRNIEARIWLSDALWRRGARDSSLAQGRLAVEADPVSPLAARYRAFGQIAAGQLDSAEAGLRKAREADPAHGQMKIAFTYLRLAQGRWADALREVEPAGVLDSYGQALAAVAEAHLARAADARRRLLALVAQRAQRYVAADAIATGYAALGDRDATFRWLEQAYSDRAAGIADLTGFLWDPVRDDARFTALQRRINARHGAG